MNVLALHSLFRRPSLLAFAVTLSASTIGFGFLGIPRSMVIMTGGAVVGAGAMLLIALGLEYCDRWLRICVGTAAIPVGLMWFVIGVVEGRHHPELTVYSVVLWHLIAVFATGCLAFAVGLHMLESKSDLR